MDIEKFKDLIEFYYSDIAEFVEEITDSGDLYELFETGSLTMNVQNKSITISLKIEEA